MFHKILVALDQSEVNRQVFNTALSFARSLNAQLMLIHVLAPLAANYPRPVFAIAGPSPIFYGGDLESHLQRLRTFEEEGLEFLKAKTELAVAAEISTEFTQALGDPGYAICSLARTWNANLIIIGRRGYKGLGELFMGSVSNYVFHHAPCSVLTVQGSVDLDPFEQSLDQPSTEPASR